MKRFPLILTILFVMTFSSFGLPLYSSASGPTETVKIWPGLPPMEKESGPIPEAGKSGIFSDIKTPVIEIWRPAEKKSKTCIIICPGGSYMKVCYPHEGKKIAEFYTSQGITAVVLKYRVPRRAGVPKYLAALQDAQRTVRIVRSRAGDLDIDPNKIGITGFSAGGHLTLMTATGSRTNSYQPLDEIDQQSARVNFAIPVYPAYVLKDGSDGPNSNKGNDSELVADFPFDADTPPMCFIHGDSDGYSPMGSIAVYQKLRKMNIPAEIHIYAKVSHGFGGNAVGGHVGDWLNRAYAWMTQLGF